MATTYQLKRADFIFKNENDWEKVLSNILSRSPQDLINELISSELKGRGGAGFPTAAKWRIVAQQALENRARRGGRRVRRNRPRHHGARRFRAQRP